MANFRAIAATGLAIRGLLEGACPRAEFPTAEFELYRASNFDAPMATGISLYLYRVLVNSSRRNLPPSVGTDGKRYRPPLPVDLFYMLTAWGPSAEVQQRLLGWAMRELENTPILPSSLLNHYSKEANIFRPPETVELICEVISIQDMNALWEGFKVGKTNQQLSQTYVARMVLIESEVEMPENPPAKTREFDYEKVSV